MHGSTCSAVGSDQISLSDLRRSCASKLQRLCSLNCSDSSSRSVCTQDDPGDPCDERADLRPSQTSTSSKCIMSAHATPFAPVALTESAKWLQDIYLTKEPGPQHFDIRDSSESEAGCVDLVDESLLWSLGVDDICEDSSKHSCSLCIIDDLRRETRELVVDARVRSARALVLKQYFHLWKRLGSTTRALCSQLKFQRSKRLHRYLLLKRSHAEWNRYSRSTHSAIRVQAVFRGWKIRRLYSSLITLYRILKEPRASATYAGARVSEVERRIPRVLLGLDPDLYD